VCKVKGIISVWYTIINTGDTYADQSTEIIS
jgi:hypothetical protein